MNLTEFLALKEEEQPLDRIVEDGGNVGIFRRIGVIGDSLSSGEFESLDERGIRGYHDCYEFSWGQYMARDAGCEVLNFSKGGMTAKEFYSSFGVSCGVYKEENLCPCYIFALGANDVSRIEAGSLDDIKTVNFDPNPTFVGYYTAIMGRILSINPKARFFLVTLPRVLTGPLEKRAAFNEVIRGIATKYAYTYVIDLEKYTPVIDGEYKRRFFCGGHMSPAGYRLAAKITESYMDYIIRHNPEDFAGVGFWNKPYYNVTVKM